MASLGIFSLTQFHSRSTVFTSYPLTSSHFEWPRVFRASFRVKNRGTPRFFPVWSLLQNVDVRHEIDQEFMNRVERQRR